MNGTVVLTPDQLANLVCEVFKANGIKADGLALHLDGELVGYDRAVIHCNVVDSIEIFPSPQIRREDLTRMLYPDVGLPKFSGRENAGAAAS